MSFEKFYRGYILAPVNKGEGMGMRLERKGRRGERGVEGN
jgi:hypothetical protein